MQNFIFISPNFPTNYWQFCRELKNNGMNVLGIGDQPYDELKPELKDSLNEYYKVGSLENYDEVYRAVAFFAFKYGRIDWLEANKLHLAHWFTVDDLNFLKRGGRVSAAAALLGTMLSIKPVLHVDDTGHLVPVSKTRGRKASLLALVDRMAESAIDPAGQTIFISHGDCEADAEFVADEGRRRFGVQDIYINYVGPVIGNHSGPGTLALFFLGSRR